MKKWGLGLQPPLLSRFLFLVHPIHSLSLSLLGLGHVADTRVGDSEGKKRGLSGGERRRVSIGVEVVHDPKVLILDEPTSGKDSNSATQVVGLVKGMAERHGRTVVMSMHQPGFRIVEMIDSLLVLADGVVAHFGRMERLEMSLMEARLQLPVQVIVLEFATDSVDMLKLKARSVCERDRCTLKKLFLLSKVADDETAVVSARLCKMKTFNVDKEPRWMLMKELITQEKTLEEFVASNDIPLHPGAESIG